MESDEERNDVVPGRLRCTSHVHAYIEVANEMEDSWLQWQFYGRPVKEIKTSWICPIFADQTAGFERLVVVV
jgi:hypothetical protein